MDDPCARQNTLVVVRFPTFQAAWLPVNRPQVVSWEGVAADSPGASCAGMCRDKNVLNAKPAHQVSSGDAYAPVVWDERAIDATVLSRCVPPCLSISPDTMVLNLMVSPACSLHI